MTNTPVEEVEAGIAFFATVLPELDSSHFPALWHLFTVGHLVGVDLDRIARQWKLSIADLHLLGTLRIKRVEPLRATDLAHTLHVSNAVLTGRVERLGRAGLLVRKPSANDRRAFDLELTGQGVEVVDAAIFAIARQAQIVRHFARLSDEDRQALIRILGQLHDQLDRDFIAAPRG